MVTSTKTLRHRAAKTTTVSAPTGHLTSLDGLRGLAVSAVMGYHFGLPGFSGGYLGVDFFFLISGFVVTRSLLLRPLQPHWVRGFYLRRAARLLPVLSAALIMYGLISHLSPAINGSRFIALLGSVTQTYNIAAAHLDADTSHLIHFWSLSIEFQFYLVIPVVVWAWNRNRTSALTWIVSIAAVAYVLRLVALSADVAVFTIYTNSFLRSDGLLLGSALAMAMMQPKVRSALQKMVRHISGLAALGLLAAVSRAPHFFDAPWVIFGFGLLAVGALTGILIVSSTVADGQGVSEPWWKRVAESSVAVYLGQRSYSLYVWHYLFGVAVIANGSESRQSVPILALQLGVSLVAAEVSYRFIESPARRAFNHRLNKGPDIDLTTGLSPRSKPNLVKSGLGA